MRHGKPVDRIANPTWAWIMPLGQRREQVKRTGKLETAIAALPKGVYDASL